MIRLHLTSNENAEKPVTIVFEENDVKSLFRTMDEFRLGCPQLADDLFDIDGWEQKMTDSNHPDPFPMSPPEAKFTNPTEGKDMPPQERFLPVMFDAGGPYTFVEVLMGRAIWRDPSSNEHLTKEWDTFESADDWMEKIVVHVTNDTDRKEILDRVRLIPVRLSILTRDDFKANQVTLAKIRFHKLKP